MDLKPIPWNRFHSIKGFGILSTAESGSVGRLNNFPGSQGIQGWKEQMPTIHDVAAKARVASVTVSRYMNGSGPISPSLRARVEAAINELGYVPNALARGLKSRSTRTIGLVVSDVTNPFFTSIARGIEDVAHDQGFSVILCNTDENENKQKAYLGVLRSKRVDGLILAVAGADSTPIAAWRRSSGPICLIDRIPARLASHSLGIDVVRGDSVNAAEKLVGHLLFHGHRRIGLVNGPPAISTARDRRLGYRRALRAAGISQDPTLEQHGPFTTETGRSAIDNLLKMVSPPTAVFATNNFLAIGALYAIQGQGLRVPEDIAIVTFDEIPQMALVSPFLTAAHQPATEIGRRAAELLLERLADERKGAKSSPFPSQVKDGRELILETEIVLRHSCGCPEDQHAIPVG